MISSAALTGENEKQEDENQKSIGIFFSILLSLHDK
jgi:hypothetical protein